MPPIDRENSQFTIRFAGRQCLAVAENGRAAGPRGEKPRISRLGAHGSLRPFAASTHIGPWSAGLLEHFDSHPPTARVSLHMKISLQWLCDFISGPLDAQAVADALTHAGLNVETIEGRGEESVLDVEVTSNRGDCLCHLGVARELAAILDRPFSPVEPSAREESEPAAGAVRVEIESTSACPHYTARLIRGVCIAPSPPHIARRLAAVGVRPINNVVDATNYVLMEMGQPLHAFDFAKITGARIVVRQAVAGEKLITLDGHQRTLSPSMLVIADAGHAVALAGIMGGDSSQVTDQTVDVLLESARFDPLSVRRTSRALGLRSDSSYRFERGIDPTLPIRASLRAAQLICQWAGGRLAAGVVSAGSENDQPKTISLRLSRLAAVLGMDVPAEQVIAALKRLHLSPHQQADRVDVHVPSWRLDLNIEADLIEEVARLIGYDRLPQRSEIAIRLAAPDPSLAARESIRQTLIAAGFFEAVTFSFVSDALQADFLGKGDRPLTADASVRKADATLRPSLLPGLLEAVRHNQAVGNAGVMLFETGSIFHAASPSVSPSASAATSTGGAPDEKRKLALVGGEDWRAMRGVIETLLNKLDADKPMRFTPAVEAGFSSGACAAVEWNGRRIGFAGQIDRRIAEKLSLRQPPFACQLDLNDLISGAAGVKRLHPLPQFPAARRDLSLIVDDPVPYEKIERTLRESQPPNLVEIDYVTTFRGKPLEAGKKSVTVTLVFRSDSGTLTGEQVEASVSAAFAAAREKLAASLRQ
jgi:phenylalanyl-tRNA synthetase beta chain